MVEIRTIAEDEIVGFRQAVSAGFGGDEPDSDTLVERFLTIFPLDTTMVAIDEGHIVGTFSSFNLDLTVPGAQLPMAGTTVVTVNPTHRRQGLLTKMMSRHLDQAIEQKQPIAGLWASDERIYGRFGYGIASYGLELNLPSETVSLPPGPANITVMPLTVDEAREVLPPVFERFAARTPGSFRRWDGWWEERHFRDPKDRRPPGSTSRRHVVARRDGEAVGYVAYRQTPKWTDAGPQGVVSVVELVADDDDVRRALWHFLTTIDLFPNVEHWNAPIDDPILLEADRYRLVKASQGDTLWIRLLDMERALRTRRYERDGVLSIEVIDTFAGRGGCFELTVNAGVAACGPASGPADVTLDVSELSALYLGGRSAIGMARAGKIQGDESSIRLLDDLFRTDVVPYISEVF